MASRKKPEKSDEPIEVNPAEEAGEGSGQGFGGAGMSKETQMHLFKALTELAVAFEGMMPKNKFPEEATKHGKAAKKEFLLMVRALIDAEIECVDKGKKEGGGPILKKIKVE
jgi:hypothetical protein